MRAGSRDTHPVKLLALALVLGCSSPAKPTDPMKPAPAADDPSCPLLVAGTSITVEDTAAGPSLVFVTTGDVAAVRTRGAALAAMHNAQEGPPMALGMMFSPDLKASTSEIEGGVRVTFTPTDPAKAAAVGGELRMHGSHLTGATSCEMHH
ncbi:hypothetical protein BH11MYX3_BH11MYX3_10790 [soil metagenome]